MTERKYLPTLAELIDRMSIAQLKEVFIPKHKETYAQEIKDIIHDIDLELGENKLDAAAIRDIIILAQMNLHIWHNETNVRRGIGDGDLHLTHGLNGLRNHAKNRIQTLVGGRTDLKVDNVEAFPDWIPSGYEE